MNINFQKSDSVNALLTVEIAQDDYLPQTKKALANFRKNFAMKGFRKGMVPDGLVKKMYGTSVMMDEVNKILTDAVNKYVEEQKLDILGRPMAVPSDAQFDFNQPADFNFSFELGLAPEFTLDVLQKGTVVKAPRVKMTDEELDKEIDNLRTRYGILVDVEGDIQEKDVLQVKLVELENGQPKEGGVEASGPINLEIIKDTELKSKLLQGKVGETFNIRLFEAIDRDRSQIIKFILNLKEEPEQIGEEFSMTIEKVSRMQKAELNAEFFAKVWPGGEVTDEASAREALQKDMMGYLSQMEGSKINSKLYEKILGETQMNLPDDFLKRWIKDNNEKPLSEEQLESEYPAFSKGIRWSLIVKKISKDNNLQASFEEVNEASKAILREQFAQYGYPNIPDEQLEAMNANMLAKEDHVKKTYDIVMEQKLFNFIKEQITLEDEWITFEEFIKQ